MKDEIIKKGTIVKIIIEDTIQYCKNGYRMGGNVGYEKNELLIYEKIDLENFPSFNDFFGKVTIVKHGEHAVVLDYIGRPHKAGNNIEWFNYDVYKIMTKGGDLRNIFKQNITSLNSPQQ